MTDTNLQGLILNRLTSPKYYELLDAGQINDNELYFITDESIYMLKSESYTKDEIINLLLNKQDVLKSGTNIKTINGESILGSGDITVTGGSSDLSDYYTSVQVDDLLLNKQNTLVSGSTIKTINGISLLGSGDITITGGSDLSNYYTKSETYSKSEVDNLSSKVTFIDWTIDS